MARVEVTDTVIDTRGNAMHGVSVQVNTRAGAAATVYAAETGSTTLTNPLTTDSAGRIEGWLDEGSYNLVVAATDFTASYDQPIEAISAQSTATQTELDAFEALVPLRANQPVNAKDYGAVGDGVTNDTAALQAAFTAARAAGRRLYIPAGSYLVTSQLVTGATAIDVFGDGPLTQLLHQIPANSMFEALGTEGSLVNVTVATVAGATSLTVTSTTGLAAGDLIVIQDSTQTVLGNSNNTAAAILGEVASIRSVDSATGLTLRRKLEVAYTTSARIKKFNAVDGVRIADLAIVNTAPGTMAATCRGLEATFCKNVDIRNVHFKDMDASCLQLFRCVGFRIDGCRFLYTRDQESANTPYDIILQRGSQHGVITGCRGMYGRHLVTTGASATDVATNNVLVADCIATEYAEAGFDLHPGARRMTFADCQVHGSQSSGFQIRGPDCVVSNPVVSGATKGVFCVYGADRTVIRGGRLDGCDTGLDIDSSSAVHVTDVRIGSPRTNGVRTIRDADFPTMTGLVLRNVDVSGDPSGAAYQFTHWDSSFEVTDVKAPDATTKMAGRSAHSVASAATITLGPQANLWSVTGTTNITSVTADLSQVGRRVTLVFAGILTFTDGSNLVLAGNFVTTADDSITLVCDGTNWVETGRSVN